MGKTRVIKHTVVFKTISPGELFEVLMDEKKHAAFSGSPAHIEKMVGGRFKVFGEYAEGETLELETNKKIVQSWRAADWPKGHYSKVTYELYRQGDGTRLVFTQTKVPADQYESINQGWAEYYWDAIKTTFG